MRKALLEHLSKKLCALASELVYVGLDMLAEGIARTEMHNTVMNALNSINVEYTLPPVKNSDSQGASTLQHTGGNITSQPMRTAHQNVQPHTLQRHPNGDEGTAQAAVAQEVMLLG
jgi:hypothetical protein